MDELNNMTAVLTAFDAGTLLGLIALVNFLTNLTKVPRINAWVPPDFRKWIALGLGVAGGVLAALASGKPWLASLLQGVIVGIGAIGTHEVATPLVDKVRKNPTQAASILVIILGTTTIGLAVVDLTACNPTTTQVVKSTADDCSKPAIQQVIQATIPIVLGYVDKLTDKDGAVDWDTFADRTKAAGWTGGVCLFDAAVNQFFTAKMKAGPSSTPTMDPDLQHERASAARAKAWPGK